jgi:outer membrane protein OmpA-like peptidoglycan-associated protein
MMEPDAPGGNDELTDDQLDALLASADEELLQHIQASTDPSATLAELMTIQPGTESGPDPSAPAGSVSYLRRPAHGRRGRSRRSWRTVSVSVAAAAAVAGLAILLSSVTGGRQAHAVSSVTEGRMGLPTPPSGALLLPATVYCPGAPPVTPGMPSVPGPRGAPENRIAYSATLLFGPGQSQLNAPADAQLKRLLAANSTYLFSPDKSSSVGVAINGYADHQHGVAYQTRLSEERAQAVRDWLIAHHVAATELHAADHCDARLNYAITPRDNRVTVIITLRLG